MTVATENNLEILPGTGITTVFPFGFKVLSTSHLRVYLVDINGASQLLTLNDDYTVSGVGANSGAVTIPDAPEVGINVVILRRLPYTQDSSFRNHRDFFADRHEAAFDLARMIDQQLKRGLDSAIKLPETEDPSGTSLVLPSKTVRAGKIPIFNAAGDLTVAIPPSGTTLGEDLQEDLDALAEQLEDVEEDVTALQTADAAFVKKDGTVAMEADLDLGTFKAKRMANGVAADEGVNRGQLDAGLAAALGGLGTMLTGRASRNTIQSFGAGGGFVSFITQDFDTDVASGIVDIADQPTRLTATRSGYYFVQFQAVSQQDSMLVLLYKNGSTILTIKQNNLVSSAFGFAGAALSEVFGPFPLTAGDYVTFKVWRNNGDGAIVLDGAHGDFPIQGTLTLAASNAAGSGDLKSDGTVPMTADFDNGGFKQTAMADGVADDDGATVGQTNLAIANLQGQLDAIESGQLVIIDRDLQGVNQAITGTDWQGIASGDMTFTIAEAKAVSIDAMATALPDFSGRSNLQLGIKIQKTGDPATFYPGTIAFTNGFGYFLYQPVTAMKRIVLSAGEWTVTLVARQPTTRFGQSSYIAKNEAEPARIGLQYTA